MGKDLPKRQHHCGAETSTVCPGTWPQPLGHAASVHPSSPSLTGHGGSGVAQLPCRQRWQDEPRHGDSQRQPREPP